MPWFGYQLMCPEGCVRPSEARGVSGVRCAPGRQRTFDYKSVSYSHQSPCAPSNHTQRQFWYAACQTATHVTKTEPMSAISAFRQDASTSEAPPQGPADAHPGVAPKHHPPHHYAPIALAEPARSRIEPRTPSAGKHARGVPVDHAPATRSRFGLFFHLQLSRDCIG